MKNMLPAITAAVTLLLISNLGAGEISVYKDKDGVINLTNRPVSSDTRVQQVIRYKDRHPEALKPSQEGSPKDRSRIEPDPTNPQLLLTVRGRGYKLVARESIG